jgi:hypothetical protein
MTSRIKQTAIQTPVEKKGAKVEKKKTQKSPPRKTKFEDLPVELKLEIFEHLDNPLAAIAVGQTSQLNRFLIGNQGKVWSQFGARPPLDLPAPLQAAVAERVRSMPRYAREALNHLNAPLNLFSNEEVTNFRSKLDSAIANMDFANFKASQKNFSSMAIFLSFAARDAEQAGVDMSAMIPAGIKSVAAQAINELTNEAQESGAEGHLVEMDLTIERIEAFAKQVSVEMPPLSAETKAFYGVGAQQDLARASEHAKNGDVFRLTAHLEFAAGFAKRAGIKLPTLPMEEMTDDAKSVYTAFVKRLEDDVQPLPTDEQ